MLVLLPASEAKHEVPPGPPFDPGALSFPALASTRRAVFDALGGGGDSAHAPAGPAAAVYAGGVYRALDLGTLDAAARRRAGRWVVIVSPRWGAVRLGDRIPPDRLSMCDRLPGLGHLPQVWRGPLDAVLPKAAGGGLIVDCRASEFATAWRPTGDLAARTVVLKARRADGSARGAAGADAKRTHGLVVRRVVADAIDPREPEELAAALAGHFDVVLGPTTRRGRQLDVTVPSR